MIYKTLHVRKLRWSNTNPTKTGAELKCSGRVSSYAPLVVSVVLLLLLTRW